MDPRTIKMLEERRQAAPEVTLSPAELRAKQVAKIQAWLTANRTRLAIGASALIVAVWVGYYALVTLPAQERQQIGQQQQVQEQQAEAQNVGLQTCLAEADAAHAADLEKACKAKKQNADCALPAVTSDNIDRRRLDTRIDCIKKFMPK
jgi:hypothetical protein